MIRSPQSIATFSAILVATIIASSDSSEAQMPLPVYMAPTPVVTVQRTGHYRSSYYAPTVPVQVNYASYYAPQVPVVPMAYGPVPTVSAYYVPTVPVVPTYYAPIVKTRKLYRHRVGYAPAVIQPVYWLPY